MACIEPFPTYIYLADTSAADTFEINVAKGETAHYEQFRFCHNSFQL